MLILILLLVFVWVMLTVLLSAWTMWFQAYIYTESTPDIVWRGPAAGGAIMAVLLLWVAFDYNAPGRFRPLWEFTSSEDIKAFPELRLPMPGGREDVYKLRPGTRNEYRLNGLSSGRPLPTRPQQIIVIEGSEKSVFKPERDQEGNFKQESTTGFGRESKEPLRYIDEKGRVMLEDSLGQLTKFRGGIFVGNIFLNITFLAVIFVAMWLLLRFQWPHALGQAIALWLLVSLFVMPPLLTRTESVAEARAAARPAS